MVSAQNGQILVSVLSFISRKIRPEPGQIVSLALLLAPACKEINDRAKAREKQNNQNPNHPLIALQTWIFDRIDQHPDLEDKYQQPN